MITAYADGFTLIKYVNIIIIIIVIVVVIFIVIIIIIIIIIIVLLTSTFVGTLYFKSALKVIKINVYQMANRV